MAASEWKAFTAGVALALLMCLLFLNSGTNRAQSDTFAAGSQGTFVANRQNAQAQPHVQQIPPPPPPPPPPSQSAAQRGYVESKRERMPRVCLQGDTSEAYYRCRRDALLRGCSEICDTSIKGEPSLFFDFVSKHVDCAGVWMNEEIDAGATDQQWPPPQYPPDVFLDDYKQHGNIQVLKTGHYKERYSGGSAYVSQWDHAEVENQVQLARMGVLDGTYGRNSVNELRQGLKHMDIAGKRVLVIGSERPWVEACVLEAGVAEVWTLEYGRIVSTHPKIKTVTPDEAREMYIKGTLPQFDSVVTYSSVEHSGLGRYGDALNPWGDLQAIARAWCVTKPGGQMLLGVQEECAAGDTIEFNLHRCYSKTSYMHLTANWKQEYKGRSFMNGLVVLRKVDAPAAPRAK
jgi:hypothetical protein